jgi:hypothetical protein
MKLAKAKVSVNCPVCYAGSSFDLSDSKPAELSCDDCGFILSENQKSMDSGHCIFCQNEKFYVESFLSVTFFGSYLVCYVCEAKYKGFAVTAPDKKFDEETARQLRDSEAGKNLRQRVKRYHQS